MDPARCQCSRQNSEAGTGTGSGSGKTPNPCKIHQRRRISGNCPGFHRKGRSDNDKYPLTLGLRMCIDTTDGVSWNNIMAMSVVSIITCILLFFFAQKYFVEGIATTGLKG